MSMGFWLSTSRGIREENASSGSSPAPLSTFVIRGITSRALGSRWLLGERAGDVTWRWSGRSAYAIWTGGTGWHRAMQERMLLDGYERESI